MIANIPTWFEKGATNATETYTWNEEHDRIDVDFTFFQDKPDGKQKTYTQKGWVHNKETNSEWRVQPLWPLKLAYLILDVGDGEDYEWTTVGVPGNDAFVLFCLTKGEFQIAATFGSWQDSQRWKKNCMVKLSRT